VTKVEELIKYAKSLGIPVRIVAADLGYYDAERSLKLQKEEDVTLVTDVKINTVMPDSYVRWQTRRNVFVIPFVLLKSLFPSIRILLYLERSLSIQQLTI